MQHTLSMNEKSGRARSFACIVILIAFAFMMFSDGIANGTRSFFTAPDNRDQYYPWYDKIASSIHQGHLPLWNPNALAGYEFAGDFLAGIFYPPLLAVEFIFGNVNGIDPRAIEYLAIAHFALAAVSMFAFAREMKLTRLSAVAAGLVFAFSGMLARRASGHLCIFWGMCLTPVALYFTIKYFKQPRLFFALATGGTVALQILSGHVSPAFYTVLMVGALAILNTARTVKINPKKTIAQMGLFTGVAGITAVISALPQLLLAFQYLPLVYRWVGMDHPISMNDAVSYHVFAYEYIIEPKGLLNLIDPWRFGLTDGDMIFFGLLPAIFALLTAFYLLNKGMRQRLPMLKDTALWVWALAILAFLIALGHNTPLAAILQGIPFVSQVRELGRYAFIWHVCMAFLVGMGVEALLHIRLPIQKPVSFTLIAFAILLAGVFVYGRQRNGDFLTYSSLNQFLPVIALIIVAVITKNRIVLRTAAVIGVAASMLLSRDLYLFKSPSLNNTATTYATTPITSFLEKGYGRYRVLFDDSSGLPANYGVAFNFETKMGYVTAMYRPYFDFISQDWSLNSKVNDLLNIRYVVAKNKLPLKVAFEDPTTKLTIYERNSWYPRAFFRSQINLSGPEIEAQNRVSVASYSDLQQVFLVNTDQPEEVIFSEVNYPGWIALIDNKPVEIKTATIDQFVPVLRSINVPEGNHTITFIYRPSQLEISLVIWGICIAILAGFMVLQRFGRISPLPRN